MGSNGGASYGKGDSNNTTTSNNQQNTNTSQQSQANQNVQSGTQGTYGSNSQIGYLDPAAIAAQQQQYSQQTGTAAQNAADTYGQAYGGYSSLLQNPGYSPATQAAISQTANAAAQQQIAKAQNASAGHAAETGNDAAYTAGLSAVTADAANQAAQRQRDNQLQFAQEAERQKELGLSGMQQLTGVENAANLGLMGQAQGLNTLRSGESTTGQNANNMTGTSSNTGNVTGTGQTTNQGTVNQAGSYAGQNISQGGVDTQSMGNDLLTQLKNLLNPSKSTNSGKPSTSSTGGQPGVNPATGKQDPNYTADGTKIGEPDHNGLMPGEDGYGEISPGDSVDANGLGPDDPGYNPFSDVSNSQYDSNWMNDPAENGGNYGNVGDQGAYFDNYGDSGGLYDPTGMYPGIYDAGGD